MNFKELMKSSLNEGTNAKNSLGDDVQLGFFSTNKGRIEIKD